MPDWSERIQDYYSVTPKGFKLITILGNRMTELDTERTARNGERLYSDDTSTPEWQEYLRLLHNQTILIRASSLHGMFINPTYQAEEEEALEDLLEGGYIVRSSE